MDIYKILETMQQFAGEPEQKPGEQWKGRDASTPGTKLVGECDSPMSLADKLKARWEETKREKGLAEAGANNPPQGGTTNPVDAAVAAKQLSTTQQNLNKLKSAGVNLPTGTAQAAKSAVATASNPGAVQGQGMGMDDKKTATALGQEMEKLVTTGNPSQVAQVANAIKQASMGQK